MEPVFFRSPAALRRRLAGESSRELWVGFHKVSSGKGGLTYREALDEALCCGWIDGVRRSLVGDRWMIRFSPRKRGSAWSRVNIERAEELRRLGRMTPAGLKAFEGRDRSKDSSYSYETAMRQLAPELEKRFRANKRAWTFWESQPPGYRRTASWWVMSAKKQETRLRRLAQLMKDSEEGRRPAPVTPPRRS